MSLRTQAPSLKQPIEIIVDGEPISKQNQNRSGSKKRWMRRVHAAAVRAIGEDFVPVGGEVSALVIYFYIGETDRDLDNIVKPILDAMNRVVYRDDGQITHLVLRKTEQSMLSGAVNLPDCVLTRMGRRGMESFIYIRIDNPPNHQRIPMIP